MNTRGVCHEGSADPGCRNGHTKNHRRRRAHGIRSALCILTLGAVCSIAELYPPAAYAASTEICNARPEDVDCDGKVDVLDVTRVIAVAFRGNPESPACCDPVSGLCNQRPENTNCDDVVNVLDIVQCINVAFKGAPVSDSCCGIAAPIAFYDSFEDGLTQWSVRSMDVEVDTTEVAWHIVTSDQMAAVGTMSAELFVDNLTDAAKVWLERSFAVQPQRAYQMMFSFGLASADAGEVSTFNILANVLATSPSTPDDVVQGVVDGDFPEGTYNGGVPGYVWLHKSIAKDIIAGPDGTLHVILGVWGIFEGPRTYFFDDCRIVLTELP